jgi:CO dehydrogenase maturation factor
MSTNRQELQGCRIGLFGRGGCGKSTLTVFLARALAWSGHPVCVLDADSTNEGLAGAFGAGHAPDSLLEWFGGTVFSGGPVTCPVDDPVPLPAARVSIRDLPERFVARSPEGILLLQAGKMGSLGPGGGCDGPMTKIARDFRLLSDSTEPVTVIDFKAGVEDVSRGVITALDWLIGVIDPSFAGVRAAFTLEALLRQMQGGAMPATRHLPSPELAKLTEESYRNARTRGARYVLNRVPDVETERQLLRLLQDAGIQPSVILPDEPSLRRAWLEGTPLESTDCEAGALRLVRTLGEPEKPRSVTSTP